MRIEHGARLRRAARGVEGRAWTETPPPRTLAAEEHAMTPTRRAALALPLLLPGLAAAQARTIRLVVPYPPGGGADTTARLLAEPMGALLGQGIVVENRGGAGGSIGAAAVAQAAPDGQTLMLDAGAHVVNPALMRGLPFDYARAFAPISQVTVLPQLLVVREGMPGDLAGFVALARARPLNFGSSGNATSSHLAGALFARRAGFEMNHVPYRGGGPAVQDLLAGNIDWHMATVSSAAALVQAGRLRALGVTHTARVPSLPAVPTIAESGYPGFEANGWLGLAFPAKTPTAIVNRLQQEALAVMALPDLREQLQNAGLEPSVKDGAAFKRYVQAELVKWTKLIKESNVKAD
jgi:tripartite-type tricarboxylate transporter receptor subunit TctC